MADETTPPTVPTLVSSEPRTAPLAICSLGFAVVSLVSLLTFPLSLAFGISAVVCGHLARSRIRKSDGGLRGAGIALAGLIVGYVGIAIAMVFTAFATAMLVDMIRSDRARVRDLDFQKKEIISDDNKSKITVSGHWVKRTDLNTKASLQAAYNNKEMYVMVISEPKSTVSNITLEQHHQLTRDHMLQKMKDSSGTQPVSVSIDNHPALQDEISGIENGANIVFLHTTVDEGDDFDQVLAWTFKSRWPANQQELRNATQSFHAEK